MDDEPLGCYVIVILFVVGMAAVLLSHISDPENISYNEAYQVYEDTRDYTASLNPNERENSCNNLANSIEAFRQYDEDHLVYMWQRYEQLCLRGGRNE